MVKHELTDGENPSQSRQKLDTSSHVTVRAIVTNREAAILIGEAGRAITELRSTHPATGIDVSEQLRGAIERILTVTGAVEDVSATVGAALKVLLGETEARDGDAGAPNETTLRLAIPHAHLGAIIGARGYRLREVIESSKTQIYASEFCLPLSSERTLSITGTADAIASAVRDIAGEMLKGQAKAAASATTGVPFVPVSMFGRYGHPESFRLTKPHDTMLTPANPYGVAPASFASTATTTTTAPAGMENGNIVLPGPARGATKDKLTQQIYIPNDMVGAIIGKSGSKINEIRQLSGSHIKINEPDTQRTNERLITVEGTQEQNQLALYMLYQRLESEKRRQ